MSEDGWNRTYFLGHDPLNVLEKNNNIDKDTFIFCVSRNPFTRFYAQYQHFSRIWEGYKNKSLLDFKKDIETNNLINFIDDFRKNELCFLFVEKQVSFIKSNQNIKVNKIYNLENIQEFENDFNVNLGVYNKGNYSIWDYKNSFNNEIKEFIMKYYEEDFKNFNYSFNFENSISSLKNSRAKLFNYQ